MHGMCRSRGSPEGPITGFCKGLLSRKHSKFPLFFDHFVLECAKQTDGHVFLQIFFREYRYAYVSSTMVPTPKVRSGRRGAPGIDHSLGVQHRLALSTLSTQPSSVALQAVLLWSGTDPIRGWCLGSASNRSLRSFALSICDYEEDAVAFLAFQWPTGLAPWCEQCLTDSAKWTIFFFCWAASFFCSTHARTSFLSHTLLLAYARTHTSTPLHVHPSHN